MRSSRPTPKVFFSSYRPPKPPAEPGGQFKQLTIVAIIVIGGYLLTRLPIFQIRNITIEGTENQATISQLEQLKGQSTLSSAVSKKIAEISSRQLEILSIDCNKGIPDVIRCRIVERSPALSWLTGGKIFLIDSTGVAYGEGTNDQITKVEDRANLPIELGSQILSEEIVGIYQSIATALAEKSFVVDRFFVAVSPLHPGVVVSSRSNALPFSAGPIEIQFSVSYPIKYQAELLSGLFQSKSGAITSRVDLRTPGYLYYK